MCPFIHGQFDVPLYPQASTSMMLGPTYLLELLEFVVAAVHQGHHARGQQGLELRCHVTTRHRWVTGPAYTCYTIRLWVFAERVTRSGFQTPCFYLERYTDHLVQTG